MLRSSNKLYKLDEECKNVILIFRTQQEAVFEALLVARELSTLSDTASSNPLRSDDMIIPESILRGPHNMYTNSIACGSVEFPIRINAIGIELRNEVKKRVAEWIFLVDQKIVSHFDLDIAATLEDSESMQKHVDLYAHQISDRVCRLDSISVMPLSETSLRHRAKSLFKKDKGFAIEVCAKHKRGMVRHIHMQMHIHVCTCAHVCTRVHVCTRACVCKCVHATFALACIAQTDLLELCKTDCQADAIVSDSEGLKCLARVLKRPPPELLRVFTARQFKTRFLFSQLHDAISNVLSERQDAAAQAAATATKKLPRSKKCKGTATNRGDAYADSDESDDMFAINWCTADDADSDDCNDEFLLRYIDTWRTGVMKHIHMLVNALVYAISEVAVWTPENTDERHLIRTLQLAETGWTPTTPTTPTTPMQHLPFFSWSTRSTQWKFVEKDAIAYDRMSLRPINVRIVMLTSVIYQLLKAPMSSEASEECFESGKISAPLVRLLASESIMRCKNAYSTVSQMLRPSMVRVPSTSIARRKDETLFSHARVAPFCRPDLKRPW